MEQNAVQLIQERNKRVELDKAWEVSFTRRGVIASLTYSVATLWLWVIGNDRPFLNGLVPLGGYILSTWSLPFLKSWWVNAQNHD